MKKDKSFFSKFADTDNETDDVSEDIQGDVEVEELIDENEIYMETAEGDEEDVPMVPEPAGLGMAPGKATKKEKEEEWLADYEGQLNIDMYQTKDNVVIKSTIAGVRPEDIDITVANDMVSIKGTRRKEETVSNEDYFYQECYWGNFSRSVIVPVDIDSEEIEADLKDGILTIIIPKAAKAITKKVKVKGL